MKSTRTQANENDVEVVAVHPHQQETRTTTMPLLPTRTTGGASATTAVTTTSTNRTSGGMPPRTPPRGRTVSPGKGGGIGGTTSTSMRNADDEDMLPTNVSDPSQLALLPKECLSLDDPIRPLRHVDERGHESFYALRPMAYSVGLILLVELLERFSFYGIYYTQTLFLTGAYSRFDDDDDSSNGVDWNPGFTSVEASSLVSVSTAVAYTTPFVGALLADSFLGDYQAILYGSLGFYLPGIALICLTTIPHLFGDEFPTAWLTLGLTVLWPLGTGMIKSVVNVFGARQHHPILQSSLVERYYISFYVAINTGALAGITVIPILAQHNVTMAYMVPLCVLSVGIAVFVWGTPRYVISKPVKSYGRTKRLATTNTSSSSGDLSLVNIFRISLLIVPFAIAYSQMPTTFIVQGNAMTKAWGVIDAATMNSADAASVLIFGYLVGHGLYPELAQRGYKIPTSYKFALGSALAAMAVVWAMVVEHWIHVAYHVHGRQISVLWQAPSYILIGAGEIFAISSAYEAAFNASPPSRKALASAVNIFCIGGLPNLICIALYHACRPWFVSRRSGTANLSHIRDYASARVSYYFGLLLAILVIGIVLNLHPRVRRFVESIEEQALELTKTPIIQKRPPRQRMGADEESPLLGALRRQDPYFGQKPVLNRMGSMRAGPSLSGIATVVTKQGSTTSASRKPHAIKYKYIPRLYGNSNTTTPPRSVIMGPEGRPIRAQDLMSPSRPRNVQYDDDPSSSDETNRQSLAHHEST